MLKEIEHARQVAGEPRRRWFYSEDCELWLWLDDAGRVVGFQFSYDKDRSPRSLTWKLPNQFFHTAVDTGEVHPLKHKAAPILVSDGAFDVERVSGIFRAEGIALPAEYAALVAEKIREFGVSQAAPA